MSNNNFMLDIIARLNKQLSKAQIKNDLKGINNTLSVKVIAKLAVALSKKQLGDSLKQLNNLYVQVGTKFKTDKNTRNKLLNEIEQLQKNLTELQLKVNVEKGASSNAIGSVISAAKTAQKYADKTSITLDVEARKEKAVNDILYIGQKYSKLFSNVSASQKYENLLNSAYSISDKSQSQEVRTQISAFTSELKAHGLAAESTSAKWRKLIDRAKELFSAASIIRTVFVQAKQAVSTTIGLDKVYTDLVKVNDELNRNGYADYLSRCNQKAQELATTQKALMEGATEFSKSGYNLSTSDALTEKSTILSNVGDMSASDSAKAIISGVQAYDVVDGYTDVVDKAQALIDKYNEIGNTASITTAEIAQGVQKVGSVFADSNTSVDEFIALLSAGNRQFQDADNLSLGLRTAALRIRGCTSELEMMNEETEGVYTSASKLAEKIEGLTNVNGTGGVKILEADGETFRSIYDIFLDISKVYKDMSNTDASALLELIAGKNRASAISATLNNMSEAEEILQNSIHAAGSAQKEYDAYLQSTEAHLQQFQSKLVETYSTFINGDMISHAADLGTAVLDLVNKTDLLKHSLIAITALKIGQGISAVGGAVTGTIMQMQTLGNAIQQVKNLDNSNIFREDALDKLGYATQSLTEKNLKLLLSQKQLNENDRISILERHNLNKKQAEEKLEKMGLTAATNANTAANTANAGSVNTLKGAFTGLTASVKATWAAMSMLQKASIIFAAISTAWSIGSSIINEIKQSNEELVQSTQEAADKINSIKDSLKSNTETVENAKKRYAELAQEVENLGKITQSQGTLSNEEYEEFLDLSNQLAGIFPSLTKNYDDNGNAILDLSGDVNTIVGSLDDLIQKEKELANQRIMEEFPDIFKGWTQDLSDAEQKVKGAKTEFDKINNAYQQLSNGETSQAFDLQGNGWFTNENGEKVTLTMSEYISNLEALGLEYEKTQLKVKNQFGGDTISGYLIESTGDIDTAFTSKLEKARDDLQYAQQQLEGQKSSINQYLNTWLQTEFSYIQIEDSDLQTAIQDMLFNFDWSSLPEGIDKNDWEAVSEYLRRNILFSINNIDDSDVSEALANIYSGSLNSGQLLDAIAKVQEYFGSEHPISVNLQAKVDDTQPLINNVKEKLQDDFDDRVGELTLDELHIAAEQIEVPEGTLSWDELIAKIKEVQSLTSNIEAPITFPDALEKSEDIQSAISTLRSALDSFNQGTLDESAVLDLMQQFPELIPYIDLAADGFGNLSEGLSTLISQQPEALIQSLGALKESLNTDEERAQVDLLINSLQSLSSYGDTGMEAYATTIGSTWADTANVIETVTNQFENLAKVQEAVADGLTMSTTAAAELAKMYPEILTNAVDAGNGQITLNEEVVKSILDGDKSIINAQIAKLEADKAELEARKETAIAELEIANQVGIGKGQIDEQTARNKIDLLNQELENEISKNNQVGQSYAQTAESMAGNTEQLGNYEAEVTDNMAINMNAATASMADGMATNSEASQYSLSGLAQKATDVANAVLGIATGDTIDNPNAIYKGKGGTNKGGIKTVSSPSKFTSTVSDYLKGDLSLDGLKSGLEMDISSYEKAISNIDAQIDVLKNLQLTFDNNGGIGGHGYSDKIKDLEKEKNKLNSALDDAKGSSAETKDEYEELFDFFERRVKILDDALSLLKTNLDNVTGSFAKNQLVDAQLGVTEEKFKNYSDALNMYTQKAYEALSKLPSDIAAKIKDGAVDLTTFIGDGNKDVVEAIKDYEQWADKVADCKQELAELKTAIRQLELEKFNNIMEEFTNQFDLHEDGKGLISKQIDLLKEAGQLIGESFFTSQIDQSKKQLELLENEKVQLVAQMNSAIGSGRIQKGTDEWLEMVNALSDVEGNILDCKKAMEGFDNELLQLHWDVFDRIQGQFKDLDSELSNLRGLFEDSKVTDDNFNWSMEALAQLGLLTQQYELAQYQVQQYNDEINQLNKDYLNGRYSATEYADKLADLSSAQWEAVNASESIKDAIIDLNEVRVNEEITSIEKEIDAYRELIDAQIEALKSAKDLHDYQQLIAEKTKSVTDLERQIAAMANDDSAASVAKRKQLEEQLTEARKELEEAEYQHSIEEQENALNKEFENYENERNAEIEKLRASLEEKEQLIAESFEAVKQNADIVGQEITAIATEHGITVANAIITSWQNGEMAIASYGAVLSEQTSAFIANIMGVEYEVYNLQAQANETANTLAWMFSTRADTLVAELASSYYSEQNLNYMTQALRDSLVKTLEGGYNISSIASALDSIAGHLNSVASAANNAASAISAVGAAQSSVSSGNSSGNGSYMYHNTNVAKLPETVSHDSVKTYTPKYITVLSGRVHYASGTRNAKGGLRVVNEEGTELTLPKLPSGNYAIGNEGDQILTREQTDNIYEWAKHRPDEEMQKCMDKLADMAPSLIRWDIPDPMRGQQEIIHESINRNNNVNVHYDSLVQINGDVNDANRIVKQMENVAEKAIKKSWHDVNMTLKYGIY